MEQVSLYVREEHERAVDRILDALALSGHREINSRSVVYRALLDLGISELEHSGTEIEGVSIEISESGEIQIEQGSSRGEQIDLSPILSSMRDR